MKHLQLFEGFKQDVTDKLKDIKKTFKDAKKDIKNSYVAELNDCISDVVDNYDVVINKEKEGGLPYYQLDFFAELENMDDFFENILSVSNKIINHLGSEVSICFYYYNHDYNQTYPSTYDSWGDCDTDKMEEVESYIKKTRSIYRRALQETVNNFSKPMGNSFELWDVVSDKPLPSPTYEFMNEIYRKGWTKDEDDGKFPYMLYVEFIVG